MIELYRHFDDKGELLYVGISLSTVTRLIGHKSFSQWFNNIALITVERFVDRKTALKAERLAIERERPKFNVIHGTFEINRNPIFLRFHEVADLLGVHRNTLSKMQRDGVFNIEPRRGWNPPRWHIDELKAFLSSRVSAE